MLMYIPNKRKAAAGIYLFNKKGQILLQKRGSKTNSPNYWGCFGGKCDLGETFLEGAKREFKEETGFNGEVNHIKSLGTNNNSDGYLFMSYMGYVKDNIDIPMIGQVTIDGVVEVDDAKYFNFDDKIYELYLHPGTVHTFKTMNKQIKKYIDECQKNF